ncbi:hypothetical protein [Gordonia sp. OPL2]|uniref:hypothetical protein n=1 Tax=Gordonia sp. OPL2 TaxID=2486274 RepID=UPI0016558D6B|nr:hypothetical protein [Gordonia sp. OPL2]
MGQRPRLTALTEERFAKDLVVGAVSEAQCWWRANEIAAAGPLDRHHTSRSLIGGTSLEHALQLRRHIPDPCPHTEH